MNKFYRPFMLSVVTLAVLFFTKSIMTPMDWSMLDFVFLLILLVSTVSETNYLFSQSSIKHSLTAPLTLFLLFYKPLLLCYISILIFESAGKFVITKREGGSKRIFDEKWLFNVSQYIILVTLAEGFIKEYKILPNIDFIFDLLILIFVYNLLNIVLTYTVISLHSNRNHFKNIIPRNFVTYSVSYLMVMTALIFAFEAYGLFGLFVACFFVLQTQGSMLTNLTAKELNHRLSVDRMTNAFNRNYFDEVIEMKLNRQKAFSILFIDLDDFKLVNDAYGHVIGDALLIDFVAIIKSLLGIENRVFRYGGDEFCVLFDYKEQAEAFQKKLEEFVFMFHDEKSEAMIYYHISLGIYNYKEHTSITYNELIHQVDQNMYMDKRRKKSSEKDEFVLEM